MQDSRQRSSELCIHGRIGTDHVHRATDTWVVQRMLDGAHDIGDVNPTHPLASSADPASNAHSEWRQHLGKRPSIPAQNDPESCIYRTNAGIRGRLRCCLPLATNLGEKIASWSALLAQDFVAAIAIVPNSGGTDEHLRRVR